MRITKPFYLGVHEVTQGAVPAGHGQKPERIQKGPTISGGAGDLGRGSRVLRSRRAERKGSRTTTACRRKRNGSMPVGRGATTKYNFGDDATAWAIMRGSSATRMTQTHPVVRSEPTPGDCTTCTGTCGSGARTGMTGTTTEVAGGRSSGPAGARDRVYRGGSWYDPARTAGRRSVQESCRTTASSAWASAWPSTWQRRPSHRRTPSERRSRNFREHDDSIAIATIALMGHDTLRRLSPDQEIENLRGVCVGSPLKSSPSLVCSSGTA